MRRLNVCALVFATILSGCGGEPRFDATSDATIKASTKRMTDSLGPEQSKEFMRSVVKLSVRNSVQAERRHDPDRSASATMKPLHGLTVAEINAKAREVQASAKANRAP